MDYLKLNSVLILALTGSQGGPHESGINSEPATLNWAGFFHIEDDLWLVCWLVCSKNDKVRTEAVTHILITLLDNI